LFHSLAVVPVLWVICGLHSGVGVDHAAYVDPQLFTNANDAVVRRAKEMLAGYTQRAAAQKVLSPHSHVQRCSGH
jgi:hypothetical protein